MMIVSKDRKSMINMEHVSAAFIGHDGCSIKVTYAGGGGCQLGEYAMAEGTKEALLMLAEAKRIEASVFYMPNDEAIKTRMIAKSGREKEHSVNGKKQKGHGGS